MEELRQYLGAVIALGAAGFTLGWVFLERAETHNDYRPAITLGLCALIFLGAVAALT